MANAHRRRRRSLCPMRYIMNFAFAGTHTGQSRESREASLDRLADDLASVLFDFAILPARRATQKGPGMLRPDGLDVAFLRWLSLDWCASDDARERYGDDLAGLEFALANFSDVQFEIFVTGVAVAPSPIRLT
jgi:hypothetical protein